MAEPDAQPEGDPPRSGDEHAAANPDPNEVSLAIRAVFDQEAESVGIDALASDAFDTGDDTRAKVEVLAAITARANCIAADVINRWDASEDRKRELFDHYAALKENMLNDMLEQINDGEHR